jgi:hypothetical protein
MNVRLQLSNVIFSQVVGNTCVDRDLLLDDNGFTSLFTNLINQEPEMVKLNSSKIVDALTNYVANNY